MIVALRDPMAWAAALALVLWAVWRQPVETAKVAEDPLVRFLETSDVLQARPAVRAAVSSALIEAIAKEEVITPPTEAEVVAFYQDHAAELTRPAAFAAEIRRVDGDPLDARVMQAAWVQLLALRRSGVPAPQDLPLVQGPKLQAELGEAVLGRLSAAAVGEWDGPWVVDGGLALVRVAARREAGVPTLDEARADVVARLESERRLAAAKARVGVSP